MDVVLVKVAHHTTVACHIAGEVHNSLEHWLEGKLAEDLNVLHMDIVQGHGFRTSIHHNLVHNLVEDVLPADKVSDGHNPDPEAVHNCNSSELGMGPWRVKEKDRYHVGGLNWDAGQMKELQMNDRFVHHNNHIHHYVRVVPENSGEAFAPNQNRNCSLEPYVEDNFHKEEEHMIDYEKGMARGADSHMMVVGHNVNLADPIGVDHQILVADGRPAGQNHLMMT